MKPTLSSVLSFFENTASAKRHIAKIELSKQHKTMRLVLREQITVEEAEYIKRSIADNMKLNYVEVATEETEKEDEEIKRFIYKSEKISGETKKPIKSDLGKAKTSNIIVGKEINANLMPISEINENSGVVCFSGTVFESDIRNIKRKKDGKEMWLITLDITDFEDSVTVKMFLTEKSKYETVNEAFKKVNKDVEETGLKAGVRVVVRGVPKFDDFAREMVVNARDISYAEEEEPKLDNAEEKRVELHLHTQMSQMDAVSSATSLVKRAISWGHKAIAITDHGVAQAYPEAMKASIGQIKVIYGVEGYMVDDTQEIVSGNSRENLTGRFVVFDLETTGLSSEKDKITEIGAVKIENGKVTDRFSTFVNPERPIPRKIVELTSITDEMVANAPKIDEILPKFMDFCKGCVLVAHNAAFDTGFIKKNAKDFRLGYDFSHLDTLMLARGLYPELSNHRLSTLNKYLGVPLLHHHRAVDDAKATADIFIKMLDELKKLNISQISQINEHFDMRAIAKRNQAKHIILLAKNLQGVRNLYEMISESHLKYFYRTPRLPKSLIAEKREGIIVGSACEAGELFRAVAGGKSEEEIGNIADFYDYFEIQPIGNNAYMKASEDFPDVTTDEDLQNLNRRIVELGERYNKPVVATCDVHFLDLDGADYRKILMHYKGFSDADNQAPLYFRTTEEMLSEFEYLGKEKAYEVVVTNTNKIADMVEELSPIPDKKCPPEIENAKEDIINSSIKRAEEIYGNPLPEPVKARLDKELDSIIGNGFAVMYKIARELVLKSNSDGYLVGSRGSVGSSFVAFLSGITEVNSLPAHYICPKCKNFELVGSEIGASGCDLPDKLCPKCNTPYKKDGHDIPFETFLGFKGDKAPDIDLNFSGEYQPYIHKYTEEYFGEGFVFRAGTIGTVAKKTAFGYARKYAEEKGITIRGAELKRLATGCVGVKRTSGQHPGGIIIVPHKNNIHEFCPIQHPADDVNSNIITTHFDYHAIDQNLLKLDELGHDDPTVIKMLEELTGVDARSIPLAEEKTMSLFLTNEALNIGKGYDIGTKLGTYAVPEFGTKFVRQMLTDTKPTTFSELVRISGLSHGTDVWLGNAQELIRGNFCDLSHAICARDDIMIYLISHGIEAGHAFKIMENVRKGKGLKPEDVEVMKNAGIPDWYMDSCRKIKYMFPKAHAVAYVMMAFRIAYFKVYYPKEFYIAYFSVRADDFDASIMTGGIEVAKRALEEINQRKTNGTATQKDENMITILEVCIEMYARGVGFTPIDIYKSDATKFLPTENGILPPLNAFSGMGDNAAKSIVEARKDGEFKTIEDFRARTTVTKTIIDMLVKDGCLKLPESDQISFYDN